ncbi:MAG: nucleoside-diphosphate sugar epimerase/dehydratase [Acidimicrobiales bacterium]
MLVYRLLSGQASQVPIHPQLLLFADAAFLVGAIKNGGIGRYAPKEQVVIVRKTTRTTNAAAKPEDLDEAVEKTLAEARNIALAGTDVLAWGLALLLMAVASAAIDNVQVSFPMLLLVFGGAVAGQLVGGLVTKLYLGRYAIGSMQEIVDLSLAWASGAVVAGIVLVTEPSSALRITAFVASALLALVGQLAPRVAWRRRLDSSLAAFTSATKRVIVFGAGEGGEQIIRSMIRGGESGYAPVAILDDNPSKRHRSILGVEVVGTRHDLVAVAKEYQADILLVAIPSAGSRLIGELYDRGLDAGIEVRVLPAVSDLLGMFVGVGDIRPLTEQDLLGRDEVEIDIDRVASYITDKVVLVTGAGGSIGSELCRQLHRFAPAELIMLDRDENALHSLQLSIEGRALLDSKNLVVADIRDRDRIEEIMLKRTPDVVFHAAALKHVTLLENNPDEGFKTNALGTYNVMRAAAKAGVASVVNVSTDKAADPCNQLGYTKQLAERFTAAMAEEDNGSKFVSVRFGNVLGSRGSVLPTFRAQIDAGGPVTVTDPEVTRYFMTIPEATRLVMEAGAIGRNGEILILDMGEPVKIVDLAKRLIAHQRPGTRIEFTGLRPGEKMHEILLGNDEIAVRREHPRVMHTMGDPLPAEYIERVEAMPYSIGLETVLDLNQSRLADN